MKIESFIESIESFFFGSENQALHQHIGSYTNPILHFITTILQVSVLVCSHCQTLDKMDLKSNCICGSVEQCAYYILKTQPHFTMCFCMAKVLHSVLHSLVISLVS